MLIDEEAMKLINEQYERAKALLTTHKDGHKELAELLFQKEVIFAEDVERIFGKRPWVSRSQEIIEANASEEPRLEDMPEEVRKAQEEHERAKALKAAQAAEAATDANGKDIAEAAPTDTNGKDNAEKEKNQ